MKGVLLRGLLQELRGDGDVGGLSEGDSVIDNISKCIKDKKMLQVRQKAGADLSPNSPTRFSTRPPFATRTKET